MLHDWLRFFYDWPGGAIWGNVVVVTVVAPLGWAWSKTRFWPIRPLEHAVKHLHEKFDAHRSMLEAEHGRQEQHRRWQYDAHVAAQNGEPVPPHPHFDLKETTDD